MKYALKVLIEPDTWLYMSEGPVDNMRVWTTETFEEAERYKNFWIREGYEDNIEIVEYQP